MAILVVFPISSCSAGMSFLKSQMSGNRMNEWRVCECEKYLSYLSAQNRLGYAEGIQQAYGRLCIAWPRSSIFHSKRYSFGYMSIAER